METVVHRMNRHIRSALLVSAISFLLAGCTHQKVPIPASPPEVTDVTEILATDEISKAQALLAALGYDVGPIDGILGPRSVAAIRAFQKDRHVEEDGKLTRPLYARLEAAPATLPRDTLPSYEVGETFIYSDGSSEIVKEVDDSTHIIVDGVVDGSRRSSKWRNFLILAAAGERTDAPVDFLQPLRPGARDEYRIYRRAANEQQEVASTVSCSVGGIRRWSVPAGKFKTIEVTCTEATGAAPVVEREWAYAPTLHQVVRDVMKRGGKIIAARDLVAIRPGTDTWPTAARSGFDWAVVNALRDADKGSDPVAWASTGIDERFSIQVDRTPMASPIRSSNMKGAKPCLRYRLVRTEPAASGKIYPGLACRSDDGEWRIPARQPFLLESPPKGL